MNERTNELDHDRGGNPTRDYLTTIAMLCNDCGRPIYYDRTDENYHHAIAADVGCFLIRAEQRADDLAHPMYARDDAVVEIPGSVFARYVGGRISRISFTPFAADAGYFGPAAMTSDPEIDALIDVEDLDGPFWAAMRVALAAQTWIRVDSVTADDETTWDGPSIGIEWSE